MFIPNRIISCLVHFLNFLNHTSQSLYGGACIKVRNSFHFFWNLFWTTYFLNKIIFITPNESLFTKSILKNLYRAWSKIFNILLVMGLFRISLWIESKITSVRVSVDGALLSIFIYSSLCNKLWSILRLLCCVIRYVLN